MDAMCGVHVHGMVLCVWLCFELCVLYTHIMVDEIDEKKNVYIMRRVVTTRHGAHLSELKAVLTGAADELNVLPLP